MLRLVIWLLVGLVFGLIAGLYLGWVQFPVEYVDSPMQDLDPRYQDEYTVMVAAGYAADGDWQSAIERLNRLGVDNVPAYVQNVSERYISNSRSVDDIRYLVNLAEGLGRLTPIMQPYLELGVPGRLP